MQIPTVPHSDLERRIAQLGGQLLDLMEKMPTPGIFSKKGAYARLMEWSLKDPVFKTQLFRFIDVLPSLQSSSDIVRHLQEYLGDNAAELNPAMKTALAASSFAPGLVAGPIKAQVVDMGRQFVAGETATELVSRFLDNATRGISTTIDLLGETVVSEAEADEFLRRNLDVIETVHQALLKNPTPAFSDRAVAGVSPRLNLSIKVSALTPEIHPADPQNSIASLKKRLRPILRRAGQLGAFVNFDMESFRLKDVTLSLFKSILEEAEFSERPHVGIAIQAYLRDAESDLILLHNWAKKLHRPITVRLVKGAYWDYETVLAKQRGWPVPVWSEKSATDANFEQLSVYLLDHHEILTPALASHNVRSCAHAIAYAEFKGIDPRIFEFQSLYGMADDLKGALIQLGFRVREYCPVGDLLPGMAYLVRRLLENTSNEGFLRAKNTGEATRKDLLVKPIADLTPVIDTSENVRAPIGKFHNAPNTDFTIERHRSAVEAALRETHSGLGKTWPLWIGGKKVTTPDHVPSVNPTHPNQIVGYWGRGTIAHADAAVASARDSQPKWARLSASERCMPIERAAEIMQARRMQLIALEVLEAGKPWIEADADISEAIDFCRFYATEMKRLTLSTVTQDVPGEENNQVLIPRGVGVVIAPWNFPLAILCGMTVAPLAAGNAVIMKPAEQTSIIANAFMQILSEAGVPAGVVNLITGLGEEVGAHLVAHPQIDFIAFTGSREVGTNIWESAASVKPGQTNLKKVVCEMGGKNALIIDSDADLDEAIPAALYSAFGYSGQKCSALSRLIVISDIYDKFVARFVAAAASLPAGDPAFPGTVVGPVIDEPSQKKIAALIATGKKEARLVYEGTVPAEGYFIPVTIFADVEPDSTIATVEIFGPVVAIIRAKDLSAALQIANSTEYALTGGIFSRSPRALDRARSEFNVGNLYLNRGITGALVERHPFGGFKMSGGGTKAGGPGYLENFLFPKVISENTLRRGFVPPSDASKSDRTPAPLRNLGP